MRSLRRLMLPMLTVLAWTVIGCDRSDPRLAELARQSLDQQARQNEQLARQSEAVIQESHRLTKAAEDLVSKDAEARQDLVQAQRELNGQAHAERASLDRQREDMESERRQLAEQRARDPIVAATVEGLGIVLACLLPLFVCLYVLRHLGTESTDHEVLNELLVQELTSASPLFLPAPATVPRLDGPTPQDPAAADTDQIEKPF